MGSLQRFCFTLQKESFKVISRNGKKLDTMARIMASYQIPKTKCIDLKPLNRGGGRFPLKKHPAVQPEAYAVNFLKSLPQSDMELFTQGPGKYQGKGNIQNFGSSYTLALILH